MRRLLWPVICGVFLFLSVLAQEADDVDETAGDADAPIAEEGTPAESAEPEQEPAPVVDDTYYQDVDDKDFRPSEEIPADQSIPFPSDI